MRKYVYLVTSAVVHGLIPLFILLRVTRELPLDQISQFTQLWVAFNIISLATIGTIESQMARFLTHLNSKRNVLNILLLGISVSTLLFQIYLIYIGIPLTWYSFTASTLLFASYALFSFIRGLLIYHGFWHLYALVIIINLVISLISLQILMIISVRIASVFTSLGLGFIVSALVTLFIFRLKQKKAKFYLSVTGKLDFREGLREYLGFCTSSFLVLALPSLPIIAGAKSSLTEMEFVFLLTAPIIIRISASLAGAFSPYFLHLYMQDKNLLSNLFKYHLLVVSIPAVIAFITSMVLYPNVLEWYTNYKFDIPYSTFLFLIGGEVLFAIASVFRVMSISNGKSMSQLMSWLASILVFFTSINVIGDLNLTSLVMSVFFSACALLLCLITFNKWVVENNDV